MLGDAELGNVIRTFLPALLKERGVTKHQLKVLKALANCRTPNLGGSAMACHECGLVHYVLHSCRNRHCPRCQGIDRELWIEARKNDLLPVKYYHVVFTVPHLLLEIFRYNRKTMYNLLFEKAWETMRCFAKDPKLLGAKAGAIAVLHIPQCGTGPGTNSSSITRMCILLYLPAVSMSRATGKPLNSRASSCLT